MTSYDIALKIAREPQFIKRNLTYKKSFHWRYLFYRLARPCLKGVYKVFKLTHPHSPWTSQASIKIFKYLLTSNMTGFEYGSGNSTIFFARRLKHLTSVEHQEAWFKIVQRKLKEFSISNIDYHFIPPQDKKSSAEYSFYEEFGLTKNDFKVKEEYEAYFSFVSRYPDNHFDFIMVDGRARVECSLLAIPKLKPAGIFVLDNSDRDRYVPVFRVLQGWKKITTTTGLFDTTLWFKPENA